MPKDCNDHPKSTQAERTSLAAWVQSTPDPASQWIDMSVPDVCTLLNRSAKTLSRARDARDEAHKNSAPIDGRSLASIDYIPPSSDSAEFRYQMSEIKEYWRRRIGAAKAAVLAESGPAPTLSLRRTDGFAEFMATAMPVDTWPFAIQDDGRPMDMFLAIESGCLTGKAERLTLREFGTRLADASSRAFALFEAEEMRRIARDPLTDPWLDEWDTEFSDPED